MTPMGSASLLFCSARRVALAPLDRQAHVEVPALGDARYVGLGVHDLDVGLELDVGGGDLAGAVLGDLELYRLLALQLELQALDVEDDVHDVLLDAGIVENSWLDALYPDLGDRGPRETREHHAPERVA